MAEVTASIEKRTEQLHKVHSKAISESLNEVDQSQVNECFTNIQSQLGGTSGIRNVFQSIVSKSEERMAENFTKLCELKKIEDCLRHAVNPDGVSEMDINMDTVDGPMKEMILSTKTMEKEQLKTAIRQLDGEVKRTKENLNKLKADIQKEIALAGEECQKMSQAAGQFATGNNQ
mmetsp:Transcript_22293/g.37295  ORF Transcript_22293/g.37295 Transcript_22293/m.37295 type:complete len:175 (-) Transcript_22293:117-641(-)|eukprot:CAMPEP_0174971032 /NCGR_PEP_ID=MMETSP0004_2-20121128/9750_1 /TAXON_ID=420556 /ORGANISM="Ochromonas sp., Strain CCMP1393" /LENGTH=174 /DNA_ID=CAMNT_0016220903 /DNA_START=119 /DNA_END=643 /DNA_ORIENTATION=-